MVSDTPWIFSIPPEVGYELFSFTPPNRGTGRISIQFTPTDTQEESLRTDRDLKKAIDMRAVETVGDTVRQIRTDVVPSSEGNGGLQFEFPFWDSDDTVFLLIKMMPGTTENSFSVVFSHSSFYGWTWEPELVFSVSVLSVFIAGLCLCCFGSRCLRIIASFRDTLSFGARGESGEGGEGLGGDEGVPGSVADFSPSAPVEVTTSEPIPATLVKVQDTLFRRPNPALPPSRRQDLAGRGIVIQVADESQDGAKSDAADEGGGEDEAAGGTNTSAAAPGGDVADATGAQAANTAGCDAACCAVCFDGKPDAVLLECGHGGLCVACGDALWREGPGRRQCPMCRKVFTGVMRIVEEEGDTVQVEAVHYAMAPCTETPPPAEAAAVSLWSGFGTASWVNVLPFVPCSTSARARDTSNGAGWVALGPPGLPRALQLGPRALQLGLRALPPTTGVAHPRLVMSARRSTRTAGASIPQVH